MYSVICDSSVEMYFVGFTPEGGTTWVKEPERAMCLRDLDDSAFSCFERVRLLLGITHGKGLYVDDIEPNGDLYCRALLNNE